MAGERTRDVEPDTAEAKAVLRRLAGADTEEVIYRAVAAVDYLDAAVAFVEGVGVDELARAVEATTDAGRGESGRSRRSGGSARLPPANPRPATARPVTSTPVTTPI